MERDNRRKCATCPFTKREWAVSFALMPAQPAPSPKQTFARKIVIDLSIMTVIGVVLAFVGPFGSVAQPLAYRLVSWVSFAWSGYAI